jgi:hypothetical protein
MNIKQYLRERGGLILVHKLYFKTLSIKQLIQMKKLLLILFIGIGFAGFAQEKFSNCSAVLLDGQMIVEEYSSTAKAKIYKDATGWLTVGAVKLDEANKGKAEVTEKLEFGVAIKDASTGTIVLFSTKEFMKIEAEKVLNKCKRGDSIIILTTDSTFALPHNEILVY